MSALTQRIKRGLSRSNLLPHGVKISSKEPGHTLVSSEAGSILKFEDFYRIEHHLSKGSFGVVYVASHVKSGVKFAVKVIERAKLSEKETAGVEREVSILKDCRDVVNVVQLVDFFTSPQHFYVVQVYAHGGDVFERLAQRTSYTESDARNLAKHLIEAVEKMHSRKLAHRDLKPENLLLCDILDDASILVADFGFASYVPEEGLKTRCGTPAFVGPEVLAPNCRYDERCDMWSVGCLLYMLIGGYPPFQDKNHKGLYKKVRAADYVFHDAYWKNVSVPAKQLIASLLTVDVNYRSTARHALDTSVWLSLDENLLRSHDLTASLGEIRKYYEKRSLKGTMNAVMLTVKNKFKSAGDVDTSDHGESDSEKDGTAADLIQDRSFFGRDPYIKENSDSVLLGTVLPALRFYELYEVGQLLHNGQTAKVYECKNKRTHVVFAVKMVERKQRSRKAVKKTMAEMVLREVAILDSLKHENIIEIKELFEDDDHFFLVMDYMRGGDVFERLLEVKKYCESDARKLIRALLRATAFFHSQNVAHRDLKPQNLLLKSKSDPTDIVISDFGFACRVHKSQSLTTRCGTPSFVAPEVLKNAPYDQAVDMWSIGVILYVLLCGYPPFSDQNQSELFRKIRMSNWKFRGDEWENVSDEAKDLIRGLLVANPIQRLTASQALQSSWFNKEEQAEKEPLKSIESKIYGGRLPSGTKPKSNNTNGGVSHSLKKQAAADMTDVAVQQRKNRRSERTSTQFEC
jgi:serine/threonine protein kinase